MCSKRQSYFVRRMSRGSTDLQLQGVYMKCKKIFELNGINGSENFRLICTGNTLKIYSYLEIKDGVVTSGGFYEVVNLENIKNLSLSYDPFNKRDVASLEVDGRKINVNFKMTDLVLLLDEIV